MNAVATYNPSQNMQALVPRSVPEAVQLAETFAKASLVPEHLRNKPGDCLLVVMQAQRWGMDALSVAQCTSIVRGKLCYEGKLVAAVLYSMGAIEGRLRYEFAGSGQQRRITVTGRPRGMDMDQSVSGTVADWATANDMWKKSPDDMLVYRGTRQWARRYAPEALLGVYTPDEMEDEPVRATVVSSAPAGRPELQPYPAADFAANLPRWLAAIESGKKTSDEIVALVSTKGALSAEQIAAIRGTSAPPEPMDADFAEVAEGGAE